MMDTLQTFKESSDDQENLWKELAVLSRQHWASASFAGEGTLEFEGTFRVSGSWKGTILGKGSQSQLHLLNSGVIKGRIEVNRVKIEGRCESELIVCELLHLVSGAFVTGNINAKRVIVEPGAVVEANFHSEF